MKNRFILGMAVAALALTACDDEKKDNGSISLENDIKAAVEQYVPNVIYTTYNDLAQESEQLYELLAEAAEKGVNAITQDEIDAICAKFLQARQSWEESEAFLFGAASDFGIDPHIDTWPLDADGLATELSKRSTGKTIYILDEPTTGLHSADVHKLIDVLQELVDQGNTVLVIEHNLDVVKNADYIIDLGPDGGDNGGTVVATGTPEQVAKTKGSYTGEYLKKML